MNGLIRGFFILCFFAGIGVSHAQSPSAEKTLIEDKEYFVHKVRAGESLSSLSRIYNIGQKEIVMANPALLTGQIRAGLVLYIPVDGSIAGERGEDSSYIYYIALKGDTKASIARQFSVPETEIDKHNPETEYSPVQEGQLVRIPKPGAVIQKTGINRVEDSEPDVLYETHTVKARETLYALSRQYNIPVNTLLDLNPELNRRNPTVKTGQEIRLREMEARIEYLQHVVKRRETLQSIAQLYKVTLNALLDINPNLNPINPRVSEGQVIRIPIPAVKKFPGVEIPVDFRNMDTLIIKPVVESSEEEENAESSFLPESRRMNHQTVNCNAQGVYTSSVRIAFLVPLYLNSPQNTQWTDQFHPYMTGDSSQIPPREALLNMNPDPRSLPGIELCQGALIAAKQFRDQGLSVEIEFYDTERDNNLVREILSRPELKKKDLIVGPFFSELLPTIARFCNENHIPFVSPVSERESMPDNRMFFQINPSEDIAYACAAEYLKKFAGQDNILIFTDLPETNPKNLQLFRNQLDQKIPGFYRAIPSTAAEEAIKAYPLQKTHVIILSANEAYVMKTLAMLNVLYRNQSDIQVLGLPEWKNFNNIDIEYFHNLQYTYVSPHYADYQDTETIGFLKDYRSLFASEPSVASSSGYLYGFMGYDLVKYFGSAIGWFGRPFQQCLPYIKTPLIQTRFDFASYASHPGFVNANTEIIRYTRDLYIRKD